MRTDCCKTRWPIVLAHGMNCRDDRPICYWGRVPETLRERGAAVYLGGQDAWGTVAANAEQLRRVIERALDEQHCEKVNLIAHSKGGLEARYCISRLGMASKVASLTMLSTPNRGSRTAKWMFERRALGPYGVCSNGFWRVLGDEAPRFREALRDVTPETMRRFNEACPDAPEVYYQSWGARLADNRRDPVMVLFGAVCRPLDGETDGLVSPASAEWGCYRGTLEGVSHQMLADALRRDFPNFRPAAFHVGIVRGLRARGF